MVESIKCHENTWFLQIVALQNFFTITHSQRDVNLHNIELAIKIYIFNILTNIAAALNFFVYYVALVFHFALELSLILLYYLQYLMIQGRGLLSNLF